VPRLRRSLVFLDAIDALTRAAIACRVFDAKHILVERLQQLGLHRQGHLADFIQEETPASRLLQQAGLRLVRPGERAFFIPKQLGFDHAIGQCRDVLSEKVPIAPTAVLMNAERQQILAHAGFSPQVDWQLILGCSLSLF
jgi:hypothetical protein